MKFFDRESEIVLLRDIREKASVSARFTVVTGRRRVGKTQLIKRALEDRPYLYFYVARKSEKDLCAGFQRQVEEVCKIPAFGTVERFEDLFRVLLEHSKRETISVVIDEFQEFYRVNPSVFSAMANLWDDAQKESKMNLVVCGSVNRLMQKIFRDDSEPLYGRNTATIPVDPFRVSVLKDILSSYKPNYSPDDLLSLWTMTGGVARYVEQLMDDGSFDRESMLKSVFKKGSSFLDEGIAVLVQEFGKDYGIYFSILSAIASGRTEYSQIKNDVGTEIGGFLQKLERDYRLIRRKLPIFSSARGKNSVYEIDDCFFRFWFRFIWKYQYLKELQRFDALQEIAARDFSQFSGPALERYFRWKFTEEKRYTRMDGWWDRRGENEIDLVCEDELAGKLDFYEVKRDRVRIDLAKLRAKAVAFLAKNPELSERQLDYAGLSLEDL